MKVFPYACILMVGSAACWAQTASMGPAARPAASAAAPLPRADAPRVDLELMTWVELKDALAHGKTTALVYNGGTETRGPQAVMGGHTFVAHAKAVAIAQELGNAIAVPVLPFSPNNATPDLPGTIGITSELFAAINEQVAEQLMLNGFKNVVLMGDHGGGQKELAALAAKLDAKYASQGDRVVYCSDAYGKSNDDYDKWLSDHGYPPGGHASVNDTAEMMYLEPQPDAWIRQDQLQNSLGDPPRKHGGPVDPNMALKRNGVMGDGRRSTAAIGKIGYDMHVQEAVAQIRQLLLGQAAAAKQ